jgi:GNAT superfamily N-acetyltransferase
MRQFFQTHLVDRLRQYGWLAAMHQSARVAVRPLRRYRESDIYIVPDFHGFEYDDPTVIKLSRQRVLRGINDGDIVGAGMERRLLSYCDAGYSGLAVEIDGHIAAHGWTQFSGDYLFDDGGCLSLSPKWAVFLGLFVSTEFRGLGLGRKLNAARLASVPAGWLPIGFILPENRYAIRNWETYGFQKVLKVERCRTIGCRWRMTITPLADRAEVELLQKALEKGTRD